MVEKDDEVLKIGRSGFGFSINECPIWLFREMDAEANACFNKLYWVVLLDWYRKAKAYEVLVSGGGLHSPVEQDSVVEKNDNDDGPERPKLMG